MKKKIIGILVCTLLIATTLQVVGTRDEKTISPTGGIELIPVLDLKFIKGGMFSISVILENSRDGSAENIYWEMNVSGGFFFYPKSKSGEIEFLGPYQSEKIKISPVLGLGRVTINFFCKYRIVNLTCEIEVKQEWQDQAILFWHSFPEKIQPAKEWMDILEYWYFDKKCTPGVGLYYEGINNMHNVRVVLGPPYFFQEIEFLGACKFIDGTGILEECGITEAIVTSGEAHWEVELVNGE